MKKGAGILFNNVFHGKSNTSLEQYEGEFLGELCLAHWQRQQATHHLLWIYIPSSPDLWPPLDRQGSTFCTTNVVVPNKLKMRAAVCKCQEILTVNIWPARKWSGEKRGASKSSSSTCNHTGSLTLYLTVTGMSKSSWKNKEEEVDSLWTLRYWSPLTCFLSFCAEGSKALERSAIFCQRKERKKKRH